uniref:DivIVA domain-containing protein n=1 Tax=candidate division WOR-3 bacterium TaxID=2052148 RepID=A0A7C4GJH7_UNCW3
MAITPLEIRKKAFPTVLRGYAPKEVRGFLAIVANELEELRKERAQLAERVDQLASRVENYERTEQLLKDTLLAAQQASEGIREAAQRERDALLAQARQEAARLQEGTRDLQARRAMLLDEIRGIANTYLALADRFEKHNSVNAEVKDPGKRSGNSE